MGRAQSKHKLNYLRARPTGFSHRVGAFSLLGSGPSRCPAPIAYAATTSEGVEYSTGLALYGTLAFIMFVLLAALFYLPWLHNAAFTLRPLCIARDLGWCDDDYHRWGGHTALVGMFTQSPCSAHRLLSWGRSFLPAWLRPFALPHSKPSQK